MTLVAGAAAILPAQPAAAVAAPFVVRSGGDEPDAKAAGTCLTAVGTCTLRAALAEANARAGHDEVAFALPGAGVHEIAPTTRLPILVDPAGVTIDGYSQPGSAPNTAPAADDAVIRVQLR